MRRRSVVLAVFLAASLAFADLTDAGAAGPTATSSQQTAQGNVTTTTPAATQQSLSSPGPTQQKKTEQKKKEKKVKGHTQRVREGWGVVLALVSLLLFTGAAAWASRTPPGIRRLYVGDDNRVSTSKLAAVLWTYALGFGLLTIVWSYLLGAHDGLDKLTKEGLQEQYYILLGLPYVAAVAAKGIVAKRTQSGDVAKLAASDPPTLAQAIQDDQGRTDLGDFQYMLFTTIALLFFFGRFLSSINLGLPHLPDVLVGLITVSAGAYVTKKTVEGTTPTITSVEPAPIILTSNQHYTIKGTGFLVGQQPTEANAVELDGRLLKASNWSAETVEAQLPSSDKASLELQGFNTSDHQGQLVVRNDQGVRSAPWSIPIKLNQEP